MIIVSNCVFIFCDIIFHSDIDECEQGTAGCDHNCTNNVGSFFCTCMDGYELDSDNRTCAGDDKISLSCIKPLPQFLTRI